MSDDRLILALDVGDALTALDLARRLGDRVSFYKIGLGMLTTGGLALARELKDEFGKRIFLDMKLFDIGATVEAAVRGLVQFGPDFLTVHGDPYVVSAAARGAAGSSTSILAVTFLTSVDRADLDASMILDGPLADLVTERARRAFEAGADGVIASPQNTRSIRELPGSRGRLIVCPGVRPSGAMPDDQKRIATPAEAVSAGADHIVVGRPIHEAPDPCAAVDAILAEISD